MKNLNHQTKLSSKKLKKSLALTLILLASCYASLFSVAENNLHQKLNKKNWLEAAFPHLKNCTPNNFYYDKTTGNSFGKIMENKGYKAYEINEHLAKYKIYESFYGLPVINLSIPSSSDSIYSVTVRSGAIGLMKKIKEKTGIALNIYQEGSRVQSGVAYIVPNGKFASTFVCFTFEEGF